MSQETEVVVDWEVFRTGTPAEVEAEIEKLQQSSKLETKAEGGATPLMLAAGSNTPEVISILIEAGAELKAQDDSGMRPLMWAACHNTNPDVISLLIESGAKVGVHDKKGRSPLFYAARDNSSGEVISKILDAGGKINARYKEYGNSNALMIAAQFNPNPEITSVLINSGGKLTNNVVATGRENSALVLAAKYNPSAEVLALIIEARTQMDGDKSSRKIVNDLMKSSVFNPSPAIVSFLFESGARSPDFYYIKSAVRSNPSTMVLSILINSMEKNEEFTGKINELLITAVKAGRNPDTIVLIVDFGADVNYREDKGASPLHHLLSFGELGRYASEGYTPTSNYIEGKRLSNMLSCLNTLVDAGADVNSLLGESRITPLMLLVKAKATSRGTLRGGYGELTFPQMITDGAEILIYAGANLHSTSSEGKTVLDYAKENTSLYKTKFYWELNDAFHNQ
jgi:ankyrin repeat protein